MGCGAGPRAGDAPMDETTSASAAPSPPAKATTPPGARPDGKPARRPPAQKAAHEAGLAGDVFLHKDALGGFTESGRKPKRLKPGDLTEKPKRKRGAKGAGAAAKPDGQRGLPLAEALAGDDIVVIPSIGAAGRGGLVDLTE